MNSRSRLVAVVFFSILIIASGAIGLAASRPKVLKLANENVLDSSIHRGCLKFAELVEKKTGGQLKVTVFPNGQLGGGAELFQAVSMGTIDMDASGISGQIADIVPDFGVLEAPYLAETVEEFNKLFNSSIVQKWRQQLIDKANVRILGPKYLGRAQLTCNRPIYKPSDLKGLKIRAIPFPIYMEIVKALGGTPTPVAFTELFGALQQNIVDGQTNDTHSIYEMKFYEAQDYLMLLSYSMGMTYLLINEQVFKSLPVAHQRAVQEAAEEACAYESNLVAEEESMILKKLKDVGMTVIGPEDGLDIQAFRANVQEAMRKYYSPGLYDSMLKLVESYR